MESKVELRQVWLLYFSFYFSYADPYENRKSRISTTPSIDESAIEELRSKEILSVPSWSRSDTEQCIQLRDEIEALIQWGYLEKYRRDLPTQPSADRWPQPQMEEAINNQSTTKVINMISGRSNLGVTYEEESAKRWWLNNIITFSEEDIRKIQTPHDDVIVVLATIANYDVKKIFVDNGSSTDILFYSTFFRMWPLTNQLRRISTPLVGFTGDAVTIEGEISLPLTAGIEP